MTQYSKSRRMVKINEKKKKKKYFNSQKIFKSGKNVEERNDKKETFCTEGLRNPWAPNRTKRHLAEEDISKRRDI